MGNSHMMGFQRIIYFCGFEWNFGEEIPALILREWDVVDSESGEKVTEQPIFKNHRNKSIILDYFFRYHFYRNDGVLITVEEPLSVQSKEDEVDYSDIKLTFKKCTYSLRSQNEPYTITMDQFADQNVDVDALNDRQRQIYDYLKDLKLVAFNKKKGGGDEQQEKSTLMLGMTMRDMIPISMMITNRNSINGDLQNMPSNSRKRDSKTQIIGVKLRRKSSKEPSG